ncbi:J domain-containing protein [Comamonas sp. JC664]|nr:J domain-containing protein [Comamonas sp. JC664]
MRSCPCCREVLTAGILGLGVRRLAGSCEVCGDTVCQVCLGTQVLDAATFRQRPSVPGATSGRKSRGRVCRGCWWEYLTEHGVAPPFPAPPGQRERAARAEREACRHASVTQAMGFCPACGDEVAWKAEYDNPVCTACDAPSHPRFNACWACGESFDEANAPEPTALGYRLEFDCDSEDCLGKLAWLMPFCPWCGEEKHWEPAGGGGLECTECERPLDRGWAYCVRCGEEAPLPEDCGRCGQDLEDTPSAARCEACRHIVCGDCFDTRVVPAANGARHERLLCSKCGVGFDRPAPPEEPPPEEEEEETEAAAEDEAPEPEPEPAAPPREPSAWEVLGITPATPYSEARRAYLTLVAQYHPDKVAQLGPKLQALALEETRKLNEAWELVRRKTSSTS